MVAKTMFLFTNAIRLTSNIDSIISPFEPIDRAFVQSLFTFSTPLAAFPFSRFTFFFPIFFFFFASLTKAENEIQPVKRIWQPGEFIFVNGAITFKMIDVK